MTISDVTWPRSDLTGLGWLAFWVHLSSSKTVTYRRASHMTEETSQDQK